MSYNRRLEIEALPAEEGWGKWKAIIGYGTEIVERKHLDPVSIWVPSETGPRLVTAYRYENWRFSDHGRAIDKRWYSYTVWHTDREYTDFSEKSTHVKHVCASTEKELCDKVLALLEKSMEPHILALAKLKAMQAQFLKPLSD